MALDQGLSVDVAATVLLDLAPAKLARMTPEVLRREAGRSIHLYGGLAFGEMLVLTLSRDEGNLR
jgi:release factor glutamine methyltransferase